MEEKINQLNNGIEYHSKEHKKEIELCVNANKWVSDFLNSL